MSRKYSRRVFIRDSTRAAAGLAGGTFLLKGCRSTQEFDFLIRGGRVFDGSGGQPAVVDVGIRGEVIAEIGKISPARAKSIIEADGLVVCPGFIDAHDHSDVGLLVNPRAESHIRQGITTVVSGNCGASPFPVAGEVYEESRLALKETYDLDLTWRDIKGFLDRLRASGTALNFATFVGHGTIRGAAMGFNDRPPRSEELEQMKRLTAENIRNGALGLSSGLEYAPGSFAQPDEITALCRTALENGGLYATHMRDEGDSLLEALDETLGVARLTGIPVQISHFKVAYPRNWGKLDQALGRIEAAAEEGIQVFCDRYPYIAGATGLSSFTFPLWALEGTTDEFLARLKDPTLEGRLREYLRERERKLGSWDKVLISSVFTETNKRFEGKNVSQAAEEAGKDVFRFLRDLIIEEKDRAGQIIFMCSEDNLKRILSHRLVGIGCDGSALAPYGLLGEGKPHPRNYGTFPRVLGRYVRDEKICPLSEMIRKITSVPARNFGFAGRGRLEAGAFADVVIFDEERISDRATWSDPHRYPEGIEHVIVNGQPVIQNGEHTGALPGRILRRDAV